MKKIIIAWICILTMILSTVSVSAALEVSKPATDESVREFLYTTTGSNAKLATSGKYYVKGSGADDVAKYLGEIKRETVLGKDFKHLDFEGIVIEGTADKTRNIWIQVAYKDQDADSVSANTHSAFSKPYNTLGTDKAYVYTLYAYSDNKPGTNFVADMRRKADSEGSKAYIYNDDIYSSNGVPHRVDIVIYATGTTSNDYMRTAVYIDGVFSNGGGYIIGSDFSSGSRLEIYKQYQKTATGKVNTPVFSHHYSYEYENFGKVTAISRTDVENMMITTPVWCTTSDAKNAETIGAFKDVVVENVSDEFETKINTVLKSSEVEKSIEVMSLEGLITKEGTAKLIKKTDGTVVEDISAVTADDVLLDVNGIYITLKQMEAGYHSLDVDENGNAVLKINKINSADSYTSKLLIAGFDANNCMLGIKVFDINVPSNADIKQHEIAHSHSVNGAASYKAFCFNSLEECVPLVESGDSLK